jgi:hypothetical protein
MAWTPPERPSWVTRLNAHAEELGGADRLVSLDAEELLASARASVGLDDFGGEGWRTHYDAFLASLATESDLHLVGRILARTDLLRTLRNRLLLAELWKQQPTLLDERVTEPVFIVGGARTGTSILFELMATDPASRCPAMWEMKHPVEAVRGEDWSEVSDEVETFHHLLQPEYETMHANSGHLPNECIFITMHEFLSDVWGSQYGVPGYQRYLGRADHRPAYRYHRRFLQTLQSRGPSRRWLLKAPSHQSQLRALFDVYPDARIIRTHRDPLKSLPSMLNLTGTLLWMRCNHVDMDFAAKVIPAASAALFQQEIDDRASGALPDEQFIDVHFSDIVRDPVATIGTLYDQLGWDYPESTRDAIATYAREKPKGARGVHHYTPESTGLDPEVESERFRFYMDHYGIPREGA